LQRISSVPTNLLLLDSTLFLDHPVAPIRSTVWENYRWNNSLKTANVLEHHYVGHFSENEMRSGPTWELSKTRRLWVTTYKKKCVQL
jgi:hypothetical protein